MIELKNLIGNSFNSKKLLLERMIIIRALEKIDDFLKNYANIDAFGLCNRIVKYLDNDFKSSRDYVYGFTVNANNNIVFSFELIGFEIDIIEDQGKRLEEIIDLKLLNRKFCIVLKIISLVYEISCNYQIGFTDIIKCEEYQK